MVSSSVLAFDALSRVNCHTGRSCFTPGRRDDGGFEFVRPDAIMKSSVGEYYANNMEFFLRVAKRVEDYVIAEWHTGSVTGFSSLVDYLSDSLRPLGTSTPLPEYAAGVKPEINEALTILTQPVRDPLLFDHMLQMLGVKLERGSLLESQIAFVSAHQKSMEGAAQTLCVGYAPQRDVGRTTVLRQDSGFITENAIASLIYPWGMQPMKQLRALVPSLDPEMIERVIRSAICEGTSDHPDYFPALDTGSAYAYEFITDYRAYLDFRCSRNSCPVNIQRQFWTPFFGVYDHQQFERYITDKQLLEDIDQCFLRSKKLYIEMLKTGLGYLSQYAVLMGMAGRWMVSGNLAGVLELVSWSNRSKYGESATAVMNDIHEDLRDNRIAQTFFGLEAAGETAIASRAGE